MLKLHSSHIEKAVEEFAKLPGIGTKTALRLVLHLMKQDEHYAHSLSEAITNARSLTKRCKICHNLSDNDICPICSDSKRDKTKVCIVEDVAGLISIENTGKYNGLYHILEGKISPMENIGPEKLTLQDLLTRVESENIKEIIFAIGTSIEADVTTLYIYNMLKPFSHIKFSTIARGVSFGDDIEDTDTLTLGKSIELRTNFEPETTD